MNSELILYQSEDGLAKVQLRADDGSVWLSQIEIAELFATTKQNVSLHAKSIFDEGELDRAATVKESLTVQTEGARKLGHYNLYAMLAVGFRIRSRRGMQFHLAISSAPTGHHVKAQGNALGRTPTKFPSPERA